MGWILVVDSLLCLIYLFIYLYIYFCMFYDLTRAYLWYDRWIGLAKSPSEMEHEGIYMNILVVDSWVELFMLSPLRTIFGHFTSLAIDR